MAKECPSCNASDTLRLEVLPLELDLVITGDPVIENDRLVVPAESMPKARLECLTCHRYWWGHYDGAGFIGSSRLN